MKSKGKRQKAKALRVGRSCILLLPFAFCLLTFALPLFSQSLPVLKHEALEAVDSRREFVQQAVDSIFSFAELGFQEFETAAYVTGLLEKEGFKITRGAAGMPTAFVAE